MGDVRGGCDKAEEGTLSDELLVVDQMSIISRKDANGTRGEETDMGVGILQI